MSELPTRMPDLPTYRESVDQALSAANLRRVASGSTEPKILLGLFLLARVGDPVRQELSEAVLMVEPSFGPVIALLNLRLERVDDESVHQLVDRDPENSLGHYLAGTLLHLSDRTPESIESFRRAVTCPEMCFYHSTTREAVFKAIDALGLQGLDRLCALSWIITRLNNFSSAAIQPIHWALSEIARGTSDTATRVELADMLLSLAGHLFATNFTNRWFAYRAVEGAFALKAELAGAAHASLMNGYATALQSMTNALTTWSTLENRHQPNPLDVAQFLPGRVHRAFAAADPKLMNSGAVGEVNLNPPECDRASFEAAKARVTEAAKKLIDIALSDPDGIFGAYLQGLPKSTPMAQSPPWASFCTPVGLLLRNRADLFRAAAAYEEAMHAAWRAGENDPWHKSLRRMMEIGWAAMAYARQHEMKYPDSIDTLFQGGQLKPLLEAKSPLTGRPYIFPAAGKKMPAKNKDLAQFILIYDDEPNEDGFHACVFGSGVGSAIRGSDLDQQLTKISKLERLPKEISD